MWLSSAKVMPLPASRVPVASQPLASIVGCVQAISYLHLILSPGRKKKNASIRGKFQNGCADLTVTALTPPPEGSPKLGDASHWAFLRCRGQGGEGTEGWWCKRRWGASMTRNFHLLGIFFSDDSSGNLKDVTTISGPGEDYSLVDPSTVFLLHSVWILSVPRLALPGVPRSLNALVSTSRCAGKVRVVVVHEWPEGRLLSRPIA
ncbi:hypothetical protein O3P69_011543 [Scylla paramamosain]|uniref:Uncharacterized protein n=1 Tax=Scylla paramamosain TaxID=85552 RepID=A0AAW0T754_SCYPA